MTYRKTLLSVLLLGIATQGCVEGKEEVAPNLPVPADFLESLRLAREACFERVDVAALLPKMDALIDVKEAEIAAATTSSSASWALTDSTIERTDSTLITLRAAGAEYRYFFDAYEAYVEVVGSFKYLERYQAGPPQVECTAPDARYANRPADTKMFMPGTSARSIEALYQGHTLTVSLHHDENEASGEYCLDGACRKVRTNDTPAELRDDFKLPIESLVTKKIRDLLNR